MKKTNNINNIKNININPFFLPIETSGLFVLFIIGNISYVTFYIELHTKYISTNFEDNIIVLSIFFTVSFFCFLGYLLYPFAITNSYGKVNSVKMSLFS